MKKTLQSFLKFEIPSLDARKEIMQERVLAGLKHLGIATQSEVDVLKAKIERLEAALAQTQKTARPQKSTHIKKSATALAETSSSISGQA